LPMTRTELRMQRLFVEASLAAEAQLTATPEQTNYLLNVLRLDTGARILLFNGRDGEWRAEISVPRKRLCVLHIKAQTRAQPLPPTDGPDLHYLFAPLKRARLDYMAEKATEMGAAVLQPVMTHHTQAERVNIDRIRANAIEAAEQCGILRIPEVREAVKLDRLLRDWDAGRHLIFCDEDADVANPLEALAPLRRPDGTAPPLAVLIGPEGGFSPAERTMLTALPFVVRLALGPRVLRADTAAIAALAVVNAALGDWR
jgi:16S rRNA (uracil1498-N3)-methyltransferase